MDERTARYRLLTEPRTAAAVEILRRGGSWADVELFLNMAPMTAKRTYGPLVEAIERSRAGLDPAKHRSQDIRPDPA